MAYVCKTCGKEHDQWPPDQGSKRPDDIWAIPEADRARRTREGDDICMLDGNRFFIRAVLPIPRVDEPGSTWGLGLWVEVSQEDCKRYYDLFKVDATNEPGFEGRIANALPYFPDALGMSVHVKLGTASKRPTLWCENVDRGLASAQKHGITDREIHEALDA